MCPGWRHFPDLPKEPRRAGNRVRPKARTDETVLQAFAELAHRLGYESEAIEVLRPEPAVDSPGIVPTAPSKDLLVISGDGIPLGLRSGRPSDKSYPGDRKKL
jgi:hypothetical protein